jgi:hypothetical protein
MNNKIEVRTRSAFGKEFIDPVDENAKLFCKIAGAKTLTRSQIEDIKALGFAVENVPEVVKL